VTNLHQLERRLEAAQDCAHLCRHARRPLAAEAARSTCEEIESTAARDAAAIIAAAPGSDVATRARELAGAIGDCASECRAHMATVAARARRAS
jgi:hypothetical protein